MTLRTSRLIGYCLTVTLFLTGYTMAGPRSGGGGSASKPTVSAPAKPSSSGDAAASSKDAITAKMDPDQQGNIDSLTSQLTALQGNSDVTAEQKEQLSKDLRAAMEGAQKPSEESVSKLASDLVAYTADGKLTTKEIIAIQKDVKAVLDSANITDEEIEALKADVQEIADASNLAKEDVESLVAEVEDIARTAQANAQAAAESVPASEVTKPTLRR